MTALLGRMRRERNGAVADAMRFHGRACGLNYGVSLPTVRQLARAEGTDHGFARMLWQQDVRELKLAALHIADPACCTIEELNGCWADGLFNSELAEEAAFALLRRLPDFPSIFLDWLRADTPAPLPAYAVLLAGARVPQLNEAWISPTLETVARMDGNRLVAQGAVALLEAIGRQNETSRQAVFRAVDPLAAEAPASCTFVQEELQWRLAE